MLKIKEIRIGKNLTQDQLVKITGIKKRSYVDYENEKSDISISKLQIIANALEVTISELLNEEKQTKLSITREEELNYIVEIQKQHIKIIQEDNTRLKAENQRLKEATSPIQDQDAQETA